MRKYEWGFMLVDYFSLLASNKCNFKMSLRHVSDTHAHKKGNQFMLVAGLFDQGAAQLPGLIASR